MRLWIDECLSPTLVAVARRRFETTCNEYRGLLHAKDPSLYAVISDEEWVLVTNNDADFRALAERRGLHSGLILLPRRTRADQTLMLEAVLDCIDLRCREIGMPPAAWMTNRVVEYHDEDDTITAVANPHSGVCPIREGQLRLPICDLDLRNSGVYVRPGLFRVSGGEFIGGISDQKAQASRSR